MTVLLSKVGGVPAVVVQGWSGPGEETLYHPPTGSPVHVFGPQQIFGAAMVVKYAGTPVRFVGAPVTQMLVLGLLPPTGSLLQGLTWPPVF
jgi:hypothetical protein